VVSLDEAMTERKSSRNAKLAVDFRLKRLATNSPLADLDARLAAARAARQKAREITTNLMQAVQTKATQVEAARAALANARADEAESSLAEARARVLVLQAAQVNSAAYQSREEFARKKLEYDQLSAALAVARQTLQQAEKALASARAAAAQAEQDATQARSMLAKEEPRLEQLSKDLDAVRGQLSRLQAEQQKLKSASIPAKQAKE
jgi:chromosome segregation protein